MTDALHFTDDEDANVLLATNPTALVIGMLLDQQVPMEWAFASPAKLRDRLGGELDAAAIAAMAPEDVETVFRDKPALHRYPAAMAKRAHALCVHLVETYDGDTAAIWRDAADADDLYRRVSALPGYGDQKARILIAILGKRLGVAPSGWEAKAGAYGEEGFRSVADVTGRDALLRVRETKQAAKAAAKAAKAAKG